MRPDVIFILVTVLLDAMGIGLIIPVMPDLIREVQNGDLAQAALWGGVLSTVFAVMQFTFSPFLGNLSDRFGRRPILLISLAVMAADYVIMAVAGTMFWLLIGRVIGGITAATHATANAYMADISEPHKKAANFGLVGAAFGMGFVIGPMIGGLLAGFGTRAPFWAAAVLTSMNFAFGLFVLRETVTAKNRRAFDWKRALPWRALRHVSKLPNIRPLLWVYFIYSVAFYVYPSVWSFFTTEQWGFSPQLIGVSLGLFGITMAIVQGGLIRVILQKFGDRKTVVLGHLFDMGSFGLIAVVRNGLLGLALTPIAALGAVITPALQGVTSRMVPDDAQGELQGVLSSLHALAMIVSPMLMTSIFAAFTTENAPIYFPGAPFMLSMGLMALSLVIFLRGSRGMS
jgi:DHA1 family tetracycline resistance protein-like MFS transporter